MKPSIPSSPIHSEYRIEIARDVEQLDAMEEEWTELFHQSPTASPPLRWEWVREWWRIYGPVYGDGGKGLRIVTLRSGSRLAGILPLYQGYQGNRKMLGVRRLGFITTGAEEFEETCAEYPDLLHAPGEEQKCLECLADLFTSPSSDLSWDTLELTDLSPRSPLLQLKDLLEQRGTEAEVIQPLICRVSNLEGGFEAYLKRLSQGTRAEGRRLLRQVEQAQMLFEVATDSATIDTFFDQMIDLHRQRWVAKGKDGSFAPRHAEFHRSLAQRLVPKGEVILSRLSLDGTPFAVTYGHKIRNEYHCYQRGVAMSNQPVRTPGTATLLLLMQYLIEHGVTLYDHLAGTNDFKERYSSEEHPLFHLKAVRPSLKMANYHLFDLAQRASRRIARQISR